MMITNNKLKFYGNNLCLDKQKLNEDVTKPIRFLVNGRFVKKLKVGSTRFHVGGAFFWYRENLNTEKTLLF